MGALIGMDAQTHWEKIYTEKAPDAVSCADVENRTSVLHGNLVD